MKQTIIYFFLLIYSSSAMATHTKGGWMYYEYVGRGINDTSKFLYKVGLNLYIDCNSTIEDDPITFTIFEGISPYRQYQEVVVNINNLNLFKNCVTASCYPCINFIPLICYKVYNYETLVELDPNPNGYIITKQRCCRINNISNLVGPSSNIGATYTIKIPGVDGNIPSSHVNASPQFIFNDTSIVCGNNAFSINFTAVDADSLVYYFCDAYTGATGGNPSPSPASAPPYALVPYSIPFSGASPLGSRVTINRVTGVISGIAPDPGEYVLTVCVDEYRNGRVIAQSRKELHLKVADCAPVSATLDPTFTTCGDFTLSFANQTDNPSIQNWMWIFGDPASGSADTSLLQFPTHTFTAAGVYNVKLIVNSGLPCVDSTVQVLNVFPGFFPGFRANAPLCVGQPVSFADTTRTNYGIVNNWRWDFGDPASLGDTSPIRNPTYTYATAGTYTVRLFVGNSKGCTDTTSRVINIINPPLLSVFPRDTAYCWRDSVLLTATGSGTFNWTPNTTIIGGNTATPRVFPAVPTTYYVNLDLQGCRSRDSIRVNPLNNLTSNITALPVAICAEDTLTLTGTSNKTNNVSWQWSPAATLTSPINPVTRAVPSVTTTYTLLTRWGSNCTVTKNITIPVIPLAIPNAGPDTTFCSGQNPVPLSASGGNSYSWSPTAGLSNTTTANPVASPTSTTLYIVSVGVTGCTRTKNDSVLVTVRQKPILQLTNDTLICSIDTLQLLSTGTGNIAWTPNYNISSQSAPNPFVSPDVPMLYRARLTDLYGCFRDDSVFVDVKQSVSVRAGPDTSICSPEGFRLRTTGDALHYNWTPSLGLSSDTVKNPFASPPVTTTYRVVANIGKCQAESFVNVRVAPYPPADAGLDTTVCIGFDGQLSASGGSSYSWLPATWLSNPNIPNPEVLQPRSSVQYIVTVTDTLGCPKATKDTVWVFVVPKLKVDAGPQDTSIIEGQPLQLNATGAVTYLWDPSRWLNNPAVSGPVAIPLQNITYQVTGTDAAGCQGTDTIRVLLYNLEADIYVPTAFTPTGDRLNDVIKPILLGMKSLTYFRVYNRYGEMMFATTEMGKGWNGIHKGKPQDTGTYVWMAEGITYKGQVRRKKGYVILIR